MLSKSEIILFTAKSLTISVNTKNLNDVRKALQLNDINWELFVKISTSQLVLPALYCNYKRKNLLQFLPNDLVSYMYEITELNRDRNVKIIEQINVLNSLLKQNGVSPIFLKGSSYLIQGLYDDIAERMIGDIDFLVSKNEYDLASIILSDHNYKPVSQLGYHFPQFKHYPRLFNNDLIAAVEIHKEMVNKKYVKEFNFDKIKGEITHENGYSFLGNNDQKALSIFSNQINDDGFKLKKVNLKNAYDFLLLNNIKPGTDFAFRYNKLKTPIMCFLASTDYLFGDIGLTTENNRKVKKYLKIFKRQLNNNLRTKIYLKLISCKFFLNDRIKIIFKAFVNKEYRDWLLKRTTDEQWQNEKLVQLKIKRSKKN